MDPVPYPAAPVPLLRPRNPAHPLLKWGEENGLPTVADLARKFETSHPRMSMLISRRHRPSHDFALKISSVTKIPLAALLELTPEEIAAGVKPGWRAPKRRKPSAKRRKH